MYTKLIVVAFLACFASSYALSRELGEKIEGLHQARAQTRLFEGVIRDAIEKLRQQLKDGFSGYPPLDPLDVTDYHLLVDNKFIHMDSNWTAKSSGLAGFEITQLSLSIFLNLKMTIYFPLATGSGSYSVDMTSPRRIFGKGDFDISATGFTVKATGKVGTKLAHGKLVPQISKLEVDPTLNAFSLALTGFMNDEELSENISNKLTNDLPSLIRENKDKVNEIIRKYLPCVNDVLAGETNISC